MDETNPWSSLLSGDSSDSSYLSTMQQASQVMNPTSMSAIAPAMSTQLGQGDSSGLQTTQSSNNYPMFSSTVNPQSSPSGYVGANPIDATPSLIQSQARQLAPISSPINPATPRMATQNPWGIKSSSTSGAFDYPNGQNSTPPSIATL